ncbi:hypothetical protein [Adlercreutzia agrestimuris]|uniref:hypothetical protein n=1 Tax=Adlercreutzia agrestimuris TaxID=2941324 RepID=UPI00203B1553|nr:hypothetical protein [Adlercreutzia agrestimuris]
MLDQFNAHKEFGVSAEEIAIIMEEAEELVSLVSDSFIYGNECLDLIANERVPI